MAKSHMATLVVLLLLCIQAIVAAATSYSATLLEDALKDIAWRLDRIERHTGLSVGAVSTPVERHLLEIAAPQITSVILEGEISQLSLGSSAVTLTVNDTSRRLRVEGDVELGAAYSYRGSGSALDLSKNSAIVQLNSTARALGGAVAAVDATLKGRIQNLEATLSQLNETASANFATIASLNTTLTLYRAFATTPSSPGACRAPGSGYGGYCAAYNVPDAMTCWALCVTSTLTDCVAAEYTPFSLPNPRSCGLYRLAISSPTNCPPGFNMYAGTTTVTSYYTGNGAGGKLCTAKLLA